ncbi:MAG: mechanosensitive ion channel [bacterium]|nr:mechanosensitive ion channel [bacterium]
MKNCLLALFLCFTFVAHATSAPAPATAQGENNDQEAGTDEEQPEESAVTNAVGEAVQQAKEDPVGYVTDLVERGKAWLLEEGPIFGMRLLGFLLILVFFKVLAGFFGRMTNRLLSTSTLDIPDLLRNFAVNVVKKVTFLIGLLIAIAVIGVNIGPLLAGVGVLGFVVGFALQDTLGNFAAGIMLLLYRPYDIGDVVSAGGVTGSVKSMTLVSTTFGTPDNQVVVVPNSKIWGDVITNVTASETRRVDLTIGISYDDDIDQAEAVIQRIIEAHELVHDDPEPLVKLHNLGESSVDFVVRVWCETDDYWEVYWDLTKSIKQTFDAEGLSMPYPQRDVHMIPVDQSA